MSTDDEGITDNIDKPKKSKREKAKLSLASQLPSAQAYNSAAGISLTRRAMGKSRKSANKTNNEEVINMQTYDTFEDDATPYPSAGGTLQLTTSAIMTNNLLEELTYKDMESLKEMKCCMAEKKRIRKELMSQQEGKTKSGTSSTNNVKWKRFKEDSADMLRHVQLWRTSIHEVEGRFGNGIRSYFAFLRWLFILNIYIFLLMFVFVCVPTVAFESLVHSGVNISSNSLNGNNVSAECAYNPYDPNAVNSFSQYVIWFFTGQGFMEKTLLFYGYYSNSATTIFSDGFLFYYDIPLAYLMVAFFYFLLTLVLLVRRAGAGLKESLLSNEDRFYTYCNKVFCGWDFCITDDHSAELKHSSLKYELQTDLEEERIRLRQSSRTSKEKWILYTKRFFINLIVIGILVASLVAIFYAAQYALGNGDTFNNNFMLDLIVTYLTSIVITVANFIAPLIFGFLIIYEDYSPAFTIKFTLIRTVFLRLASVVFLYVVVYLQINCSKYDIVSTQIRPNCTFCEGVECWETYLGQEMYKLTIMDFFIVLAVTLFVEFPRKLIVENCSCGLAKWWGHQEFSIPENVLDIVYAQTIGWIGAFYAPLLPVIVVVKFFIFFYLKKLSLTYNCRPATRPYRASRSGTFFYIILLVGFVVAAFPVVVSVAILEPSKDCGPFRGWTTMFYAITASIQTQPGWLQSILWFVGSPGFAIIIGVLLCLALYYFVALRTAHKKMISLLRDQLTLEGKDKQFLLSRVTKLTKELQDAGIEPNLNGKLKNGGVRRRKSGRSNGRLNEGYEPNMSSNLDGPDNIPGQPDMDELRDQDIP
ncbi:transmembrane channel-like protein 7 isoform X3 [Ciona intestinalis]